jgi:hypothetical protein
MKKILLTVIGMILCVGLIAQIVPYGSARMLFMYNVYDEDYNFSENKIKESRIVNQFILQTNSHVGIRYRHEGENIEARIEFGINSFTASPALRFAWAKKNFDNWSLLVGQDVYGTDQMATQIWNGDRGLMGRGAVYGPRSPQVRFEIPFRNKNDLFYVAFIQQNFFAPAGFPGLPLNGTNPTDFDKKIDVLIPKMSFGYNMKFDSLRILPVFVFQMYEFNKDFAGIQKHFENTPVEYSELFDDNVVSWMGGITLEYNVKPMIVRAQFSHGMNIGNMGYHVDMSPSILATRAVFVPGTPYQDSSPAEWKDNPLDPDSPIILRPAVAEITGTDTKLFNTVTTNFFFNFGYEITDKWTLNTGFGYTSSSNDLWDNEDTRTAFFLQARFKDGRFHVVPEIGMMMDMDRPMNYRVHASDDPGGSFKEGDFVISGGNFVMDSEGQKMARGNNLYFGLQIRYDF